MHIHSICHVYPRYVWYMVLKANYVFLYISGFNIILSSTIAFVCSIELLINTWKWNFNIHCLYVVYASLRHTQQQYMYIIWNPDHMDKNWQNCTYVSEHGADIYVHVQTVSWNLKHVCTCMYMDINMYKLYVVCTYMYMISFSCTCMFMISYICMYMVNTRSCMLLDVWT